MDSVPAYARFSRRLKALLLDAIVLVLLFYVGAILLNSISPSDGVRRALWLSIVLVIVLYEPILVATLGGTVGHRLTNLRVVDDRSNGNLGLVKAAARTTIKALFGWFSFLSMTLTRRNQALHDVLTHSTVQIRDRSKALASHYVTERQVEVVPGGLPSRSRRVTVIIVYIVLGYIAVSVISLPLLSDACAVHALCSGFERTMTYALLGVWLVLIGVFVVLGWKGRLWGCRTRPPAP